MSIDLGEPTNVKRAWQRVRTNPDAAYRQYFRALYAAFELGGVAQVDDLAGRLGKGDFVPSAPRKIHVPKPSGTLRPFTLLTVEDQVAFQAAANLLAVNMGPRLRHRYGESVFSNQLGSRRSRFFFQPWQQGYRDFCRAVREAVSEGMIYTASFDLAACYDSIDHAVLRYFLVEQFGCDPALCNQLVEWLATWTQSDRGIRIGHGIPQGPLSSSLLAEAVLSHFDANWDGNGSAKYVRYVDDIRLFARSEAVLRKRLLALSLLSTDIGLFPQTSKISIHRVRDINQELKSVSRPPEPAVRRGVVNQPRLRRRVAGMTRGGKVDSPTRFKFLVGRAEPESGVTGRLLRVVEKEPHYFGSVARYLGRYNRLPRRAAEGVARILLEPPLYPSVAAAFLEQTRGRMPKAIARQVTRRVRASWRLGGRQDDELAAAGAWLMQEGGLKPGQVEYACTRADSWWVRTQLLLRADREKIGPQLYDRLVRKGLGDEAGDVARAAALLAVTHGISPSARSGKLHTDAARILGRAGLLAGAEVASAGLDEALGVIAAAGILPGDSEVGAGHRQELVRLGMLLSAYSPVDRVRCLEILERLCNGLAELLPLSTEEIRGHGDVAAFRGLANQAPAIAIRAQALANRASRRGLRPMLPGFKEVQALVNEFHGALFDEGLVAL